MTDRSSRFAGHRTYRWHTAGSTRDLELFEPRFRTPPPVVRLHRAEGADRLDLLAFRYLDDPHRFWLIADANPPSSLHDLLEPGNDVRIPGSG